MMSDWPLAPQGAGGFRRPGSDQQRQTVEAEQDGQDNRRTTMAVSKSKG